MSPSIRFLYYDAYFGCLAGSHTPLSTSHGSDVLTRPRAPEHDRRTRQPRAVARRGGRPARRCHRDRRSERCERRRDPRRRRRRWRHKPAHWPGQGSRTWARARARRTKTPRTAASSTSPPLSPMATRAQVGARARPATPPCARPGMAPARCVDSHAQVVRPRRQGQSAPSHYTPSPAPSLSCYAAGADAHAYRCYPSRMRVPEAAAWRPSSRARRCCSRSPTPALTSSVGRWRLARRTLPSSRSLVRPGGCVSERLL